MTFLPDQWLPDSHVLAGKTILITGAGDGIGKAAALTFARHGAEVLLLGRTEAKLEAVYDTIVSEGGAVPAIIPTDLAKAGHDDLMALAAELAGSIP
ncbi:SDR family NAD(P)-dependent oxidoreductase, partial [Luminiphilus sp.]|nr:SDR family NAD(P)-dependent oxidoreductase [Luminiphilus sp.]